MFGAGFVFSDWLMHSRWCCSVLSLSLSLSLLRCVFAHLILRLCLAPLTRCHVRARAPAR